MPEIAVVPRPVSLVPSPEAPFVVAPDTPLLVDPRPELITVAVLAADLLGRVIGDAIEVRYGDDGSDGAIRLRLTEALPGGDEAYRLVVGPGRVLVEARTATGLVHGVVTLRQLVRHAPDGTVSVPAVRIEDVPRYAWRGLSLDVARHFFGLDDLKLVVGLLAHYKLNVLHLHLTDDQGWRLEMPSRPLLTARSSGTAVGGGPGGFLTTAQFAELVTYAHTRGVTVVPEIDVPGHVNAALHAYGALTPSGEPTEPYTGIEVGFSRLHADVPATGPFLADVLGDVAALTPGDYLHIGGDEALELTPTEYARLVTLASDAVRAYGKQVVGWQEIAHAPVTPGTVVQYWDDREGARADRDAVVAAARAGARVLMSPGNRTYLDMVYDSSTPLGQDWAGAIELRDAYEWEPSTLVPGLPTDAVVGVEAAIWTETIATLPELTQMLLPRLAAVAEVAWTQPERRDWPGFRARVAGQAAFWDRLGLSWYPSPQVDWRR
ncbi:beta-N-acetylhexosaminidase [Cellulomonas soli]|uniref:beta-N-acetylhexosaminidase n=1 Tax=Cellulomonas soli TaxID=931535 RepID=UPI0011BD911D|nr:beta-N-acetylhexosaminidase [Cellulomonas soli]NYI59674.1 hexosaminidase [Cellulomonas soli]